MTNIFLFIKLLILIVICSLHILSSKVGIRKVKLVVIENGLIDNLFLRVYTYINNSKRVDEYGIIRSLKSSDERSSETLEYTRNNSQTTN